MTQQRAREILERMKTFRHVFLDEEETKYLMGLTVGSSLTFEEVLKLIARGEPKLINSESMFGLIH